MQNIIAFVVQIAIIILLFILVNYIKKIPEQIHAIQLSKFEHDLNKQLEVFRTDLVKEIELMRISQTEISAHKSEEFINLVEFIFTNILDPNYIIKLGKDTKVQNELNKKIGTLGTKLFLFASDETVKKYVEWRKFGIDADITNKPHEDPHKIVLILAELMVLIREDLGYKNTKCTTDDFLYIMLNDWHKYESLHSNK